MKSFAIILFLLGPVILHAQSDRKLIRQGYKSYMDGKYNEAEVDFRKAEEIDRESFTAKYNTSTALYQQEKIEESAKRFEELLAETTNDKDEAKLYHNLGNTFMETDKLKEGIDAYKKSLRLNPKDEDTRYNLAYALEKLQEQEKQQQQEQDQDQENKDNKGNKDDQEQGDKNNDQQDKQDESEENEDQKKESGDQNKDEEQEQQKQPQPQQLSKEDAERLLNAILQKEKDVKEKVDKKKAAAAKIKTDKDW
jgi:Ca-activated chloride channel homolog